MSNHRAAPSASPPMASSASASRPLSKPLVITAITVGSGLELYDSVVYNFFATLIGPLYFPVHDRLGQLLLSFAAFGIGYVMRPVGGLVIGAYADRVGRKPAVVLTLWLMAISAALLVLTPTYAQIGVAAPILMTAARLLQGFAIGGEMGPASAMLLEYADDRSRGFYTSWQPFSQGLAAVFAALVALSLANVLPHATLLTWGWRVAFVIGVLVVPVSVMIRSRLDETLVPSKWGDSTAETHWQLVTRHWQALLATVLLMIGLASAVHIVVFYLPNYAAIRLHIPLSQSIWAGLIGSLVLMILSPVSGWLSDRIGRRRVVWWSRIAMLVLIYPAFLAMNNAPTLSTVLIVAAVLAVPMAMTSPATLVLVSEVLPQRLRATGVSVSYYVATVIFGSFSQFFSTLLIHLTGDANAPAFYIIGCGLFSLGGLAMVRETLGRRLS
ncbi:Proline/betaine transporter [Paraburkholderia caffeinitolerans]|uniref:Proline/betaine transporter n=1 Tax=Paraburkholderia caffeinitolerans TaxID=1723730 RepID=A0A6J5GWQ7_9BURK|nr:MFS transporter [Paraburkholderia caffeinitolerans]CAB3808434.1 Proline/betaine transporter [Paraburkholderia caffeinitolerans]